jgi:uncharacterized protein (TIGR02646 family)
MIKIDKGEAPVKLKEREKELVNNLSESYDKEPEEYISGRKKFEFTADYRMDEVKDALIKCQNNKCCFSEAKFVMDYSNVEHFRPKGRVDPYPKGTSEYPGYYWLAYNWSNLFLCKSVINSSNKRNFFPLKAESIRNKNHLDKNKEACYLIDVNHEEPREFINFHNEEIIGIDSSGRGEFNILFFKLRHPELDEARRTKFKILKGLKELIESAILLGMSKTELKPYIEVLKESMSPKSEFSSMAIDFLKEWPHFE